MTSTTPALNKTKTKNKPEDVLQALMDLPKVKEDLFENLPLMKESVVNVFDDKWRINLWVSIHNPVVPNAGRILKSYFVKFGNGRLEILED
jgi:hypothetical protein